MILRSISVALMLSLVALMMPAGDAEAKRLGGGFSFGGKKSFNQPQKRSSNQQTQQDATKSNQGAPANGAATAGKGAIMGGVLGGMVAGGLLSALFFGGAFENINFMDILIFGLVALLLFKLLVKRRPQNAYAGAPGFEQPTQSRTSQQDFGIEKVQTEARTGKVPMLSRLSRPGTSRPKGFDESVFLDNAKSAFTLMQAAWDSGELSELRGFTTDSVFAEIQDQFRGRKGNNETEVMQLNAQLLRVDESERELEASVLFTATLRENDDHDNLYPDPVTIEEIWHFIKPIHAIKPTWFLDGIQQIED